MTFVSYARADSEFALKLVRDVKSRGARVWLDQLDLEPGQRWDKAVENALARCERMLVILSPAAVESDHVMNEIAYAQDERKTIIPLLHRQCSVPLRLRSLHYVDFRQEYDGGLKSLLRTLKLIRRMVGQPWSRARCARTLLTDCRMSGSHPVSFKWAAHRATPNAMAMRVRRIR